MKLSNIVLFSFFSLVRCSGENSLSDAVSMSPGTLGSVADHELNCSENELESELDELIENFQFSPSVEDTNIVNWWKRNQYDFLNYKCLKIRKQLFMVTIFSESSFNTNLGIRSFYNRTKKTWVFATEFNSKEKYKAERAMSYLLDHLSCYKK
jgi:hypothetical protein